MKRRHDGPLEFVGARAVVVHDLDQARAAVAAARAEGVPVVLWSPPGAAAYMGVGYFRTLVETACAEESGASVAAVLDCADDAGWTLAALRHGIATVCFRGRKPVADRLSGIAHALGAVLVRPPAAILDLGEERDPEAAARAWLAAKRP